MSCVQPMSTIARTVREYSELGMKLSTFNSTHLRIQRKTAADIKDTACQATVVVVAVASKYDE